MNVRFMDTSIVMNLLEIPNMCAEAKQIKADFKIAVEEKETLILPMSTIQEFLQKTAREEAPWTLYGVELTSEDLLILADEFPEKALCMQMGIGDMSIIRFYEKYKETMPAVGHVMIWSTDKHLSGYEEDLTMKRRRNR